MVTAEMMWWGPCASPAYVHPHMFIRICSPAYVHPHMFIRPGPPGSSSLTALVLQDNTTRKKGSKRARPPF
jgi:hypothetical protein